MKVFEVSRETFQNQCGCTFISWWFIVILSSPRGSFHWKVFKEARLERSVTRLAKSHLTLCRCPSSSTRTSFYFLLQQTKAGNVLFHYNKSSLQDTTAFFSYYVHSLKYLHTAKPSLWPVQGLYFYLSWQIRNF